MIFYKNSLSNFVVLLVFTFRAEQAISMKPSLVNESMHLYKRQLFSHSRTVKSHLSNSNQQRQLSSSRPCGVKLSLITRGKEMMPEQKKVLVINASPNLKSSSTRMLSRHFTDSLKTKYPKEYNFHHRDIGNSRIPVIHHKNLEVFSKGTASSPQAKSLMLASDHLIEEFQSADSIVIATPMHNFSTPAPLKAYFDLILRAGKTFSFTSEGPKGLLKDRPLLLISSAGGEYAGSQLDFLTPYVRQVVKFVGIQNVHVVAAEGLAIEGKREKSLLEARLNLESFIETFHRSQN